MKIVKNKKNIIQGFKNPMPFLNLVEVFDKKDVQLVRDLGEWRCALRIDDIALRKAIPNTYSYCDIIGSCPKCFWSSSNPSTKEKQKEVFDLLKIGIDVEYIE